ncbi:winged helix-turn-helix domain-containing protein [uncultured Tessaracoccus sp.]|uniref:winged helix-turn-helix domain-containing protein n=1 Tax=uncultured Tessaracoccus sp. TaxID=905023 RepID=UPI0026088391|nr:winged helix-turn-helix domain-containing protein [uncultured Tessaracoccus sp.]
MATDPSRVLKAIASPVRMQILQELGFRDGRARVTDVADALGVAPNSISYHMGELAKAGVVEKVETPGNRDARETWYSICGGGVALDFEHPEGEAQLPSLVDSLYEAKSNSSVVARYRRAAVEAEHVPEERLLGATNVLRLTPEEQEEFYASIRSLVAQVRQSSERNQADLRAGVSSSDDTSQVFFDLNVFPVVDPSS